MGMPPPTLSRGKRANHPWQCKPRAALTRSQQTIGRDAVIKAAVIGGQEALAGSEHVASMACRCMAPLAGIAFGWSLK